MSFNNTIDLQQLQVACDWIEQSGIQVPNSDPITYVHSYLLQEKKIEAILSERIPHFTRGLVGSSFPYIQETYAKALCDFIGVHVEDIFCFSNDQLSDHIFYHVNPWLK